MSGISYLLDTNIIIGILKKNDPAISMIQERGISPDECCYSCITRMELLGFPSLTEQEKGAINAFLSVMPSISLDTEIEDKVIEIRQQQKVKLPDAIIVATAIVHGYEVITLDKRMNRVLLSL